MPNAVTVIVPIYNSIQFVDEFVESLLLALRDGEHDLLIVDNGSSDGTWQRLCEQRQAEGKRFRLFSFDDIQGSYAARNRGIIEASKSEVLVFIDADCRPATPEWLSMLTAPLRRDPRVGLVAGEIESPRCRGTWVEDFSMRSNMLSQRYTLSHGYRPYAQTANLAVRRSVFDEVGLFREEMKSGGDADFCWRAQQAGWRLAFVREAAVVHQHRKTVKDLFAQWLRYGQGHSHLRRLYPDQPRAHRLVARQMERLGAEPRNWPRHFRWIDAPLIAVSGAAYLLGSMSIVRPREAIGASAIRWKVPIL